MLWYTMSPCGSVCRRTMGWELVTFIQWHVSLLTIVYMGVMGHIKGSERVDVETSVIPITGLVEET